MGPGLGDLAPTTAEVQLAGRSFTTMVTQQRKPSTLSIDDSPRRRYPAVNSGLRPARRLVSLGMPVGCGRLDNEGNPDSGDPRWRRWQKTPVGPFRYREGDAVYAVTGTAFDVLDVDPRNGGIESFEAMAAELGEDGPRIYCRVETPRGGRHLYIEPLGLGSYAGKDCLGSGLDLKGGRPDGTGRGFVYFVPTVRYDKKYRLLLPPQSKNGHSTIGAIREYAQARLDAPSANGSGGGRADLDELRARLLAAGDGEQRGALGAYTSELERTMEREAVKHVLQGLVGVLRNYDSSKKWNERSILSFMHKPGEIIPDATPGEIGRIVPQRPHGMRNFTEIKRKRVRWIWRGYLARGEMTVLDGEKSCGKSLVWEDIAARLSTGRPMPGEDSGHGEVIVTAVFTVESSPEKEIGPRLDAAEADGSRVWVPELEKQRRRGHAKAVLEFPLGATEFGRKIKGVSAGLAVWDPVNDFLAEKVLTNNDASIRHAIGPLKPELEENDCAGVLIRHMNKDTSKSARMRGAGTTAYQNMARVHLVVGRMPPGSHPVAEFGLAVVDSNLRKVAPGVLAYKIVDSDVFQDDDDEGMVGRIEWYGRVLGVTADDLVKGDRVRKGPDAYAERKASEIVHDLFVGKDRVPADDIIDACSDAGISIEDNDLDLRVKKALGLESKQRGGERRRSLGAGWDWVRLTPRVKAKVGRDARA